MNAQQMTKKEKAVIDFIKSRPEQKYFGLDLTPVIFSQETITKWSHARRHKVIINTMTYLYLGKMVKKGLLEWSPNGYYI